MARLVAGGVLDATLRFASWSLDRLGIAPSNSRAGEVLEVTFTNALDKPLTLSFSGPSSHNLFFWDPIPAGGSLSIPYSQVHGRVGALWKYEPTQGCGPRCSAC